MALLAGAFASESIRNRLGQMKAKSLAQESDNGAVGSNDVGSSDVGDDWCSGTLTELPEIQLPECPCEFTNLPGLGAGNNEGFRTEVEARQAQFL